MAKSPVGKRLKEARVAAKLSQKSLGIAAGIDEFSASARMNQYETGKHTPDFQTLERIAKVINMPAAFFYADTSQLARLIEAFHRLSSRQKMLILAKIEKMKGEK